MLLQQLHTIKQEQESKKLCDCGKTFTQNLINEENVLRREKKRGKYQKHP